MTPIPGDGTARVKVQRSYIENPINRAPRLRRAPTSEYEYVRQVGGGAWQARVWLGMHKGGSLNLGLFTIAEHPADPGRPDDEMAEWAAQRASTAFDKFYCPKTPGRGLRETFAHLKRLRYVPQKLLPPRVRAVEGGYVAKVKVRGVAVELEAVFVCPWECYHAMCAKLVELFRPKPSVAAIKARKRQEARAALEAKIARRYQLGVLTDFAA